MDFNWFFKGFRNNPADRFPNKDTEFGDYPLFGDEGDTHNITIDPFSNFEHSSRDLFQQMDSMLNRVFSANFASFGSEDIFEKDAFNSNPRSIMLKEPDCDGCEPPIEMPVKENRRSLMIDSDIDDKVAKHGLLLDEQPKNRVIHNFSYKKSTRFVRLPNGIVEEHHSFTDSDGNTKTTIRRAIGEQSYEVTTHSDIQGLKEKNENFTNLDESELPDFENRWQNFKRGNKPVPALDMIPEANHPKLNQPPGDPSYLSLFKKFFSI
ncbi:hypothetical protein JTE90_010494 [Oedothorax gibbosus]|uniref:HCLS1-associated protein X-1 n=1 Tax=Oedothorax gibbosus TaxID=931172 RepID=A0AAV6W305_9ARAC|nr:hypothetical protein JTE90_010494 [Oedothorax gibbosus]